MSTILSRRHYLLEVEYQESDIGPLEGNWRIGETFYHDAMLIQMSYQTELGLFDALGPKTIWNDHEALLPPYWTLAA